MFCRIIFETDLIGWDEENKPIELLKNSKNSILHFDFINDSVDWKVNFLALKKIPKNDADVLERHDVYILVLDNKKTLLIQPFTEVHFLTFDESKDIIKKQEINTLKEEDTILMYDEELMDYSFQTIVSINKVGNYKDVFIKTREDGTQEVLKDFNNYIIGTNRFSQGVVINNFLIL